MRYPDQPAIRPIEQWTSDGLHTDVHLHSATTGIFLGDIAQGEAQNPPSYFAQDPRYAYGYDYWGQSRPDDLSIGVLLTNPNDPDGLGPLGKLEDLARTVDVVGFANGRSVRAREESTNPQTISQPGIVWADTEYMRTLEGVASRAGRELFSFDLPYDSPVPNAIEEEVYRFARRQDPRRMNKAVCADMVYCNALQMGMAALAGVELDRRSASSAILIVASEMEAFTRKVSHLGAPAIESASATPQIESDHMNRLYKVSLQAGVVPGSMLD